MRCPVEDVCASSSSTISLVTTMPARRMRAAQAGYDGDPPAEWKEGAVRKLLRSLKDERANRAFVQRQHERYVELAARIERERGLEQRHPIESWHLQVRDDQIDVVLAEHL